MRKIFLLFVLLLTITSAGTLFAQRGGRAAETMEVKIASPLPRESPWGRTLDRIAAEWNRITSGQVILRAIHGGSEGDEEKMRQSLASNTIQAAVFTSLGLSTIYPPIITLSAPFLIRTQEELNAVMNEIQDGLETRLNSGDYFMLAWSRAGFVNIYSKAPVVVPDELRRQKIASGPEAAEMNTAFKTMGFQIEEASLTDMGQKVATGAVMAVYLPPAGAAAYQIHLELKNMFSMNIAPVLGGIVINQVTWKRIGSLNPRYQQDLLKVTRQIAASLDESMQKTNNDAIATMTRAGLTVTRPNQAQEQLWYAELEKSTPVLLGTTYDRDLYQQISSILTRYRGGR